MMFGLFFLNNTFHCLQPFSEIQGENSVRFLSAVQLFTLLNGYEDYLIN